MSDPVHGSLSIASELLEEIDRYVEEHGLGSRAQALRALLDARPAAQAPEAASPASLAPAPGADLRAAVTLISEAPLWDRVEDAGRAQPQVALSRLHLDLGADVRLELLLLRGPEDAVRQLADQLIDLSGVWHGHAVFGTPACAVALRHGM